MRRSAVGRATAAVVGATLATAVLTSCASETERYCDTLTEKKQALAELAAAQEPGSTAFEDALDVLQDLRAEAPDDLADEWATLVNSYETLADALDAAGVEAADFDPANPPEGMTAEEVGRVRDAAAELASPRVVAAADGIEQHARDVCRTDLGLGSGQG